MAPSPKPDPTQPHKSKKRLKNKNPEIPNPNSQTSAMPCPAVAGTTADDRFESLPDAILHQILSHLSTKQLVQSSVLSHRFRHVWRASVDLSFSEDDFRLSPDDSAETLSNFVEHFLLLRDHSLRLRRLRLHCATNWINHRRVSTWLAAAAYAGLRRLDVSLPGGSDLPPSLFTSPSLSHLSLRMEYWQIHLPARVSLPNLVSLSISNVDFVTSEDEKRLSDLIQACSSLRRLSLVRCYFAALHVRAERLEQLTFHHFDYNDVRVRLSTPNLRFLEHICEGTEDFVVGNLPCLVEGSFDLRGFTWSGVADILDVLCGLSNARILTLTDFAISFPSNNYDLMEENLPIFHNLKKLKLINSLKRDIFQSVKCLLQCTPSLQTLTIEEPVVMAHDIYPFFENKRSYWRQKVLPIHYFNRVEDVDVKEINKSHDNLYHVVKFTFTNSDP